MIVSETRPPTVVAGVVPDGFERVRMGAREARVVRNAFVLSGVDTSEPLVAEGSAGRREYPVTSRRIGPRIESAPPFAPIAALDRPLGPQDALPANVLRRFTGSPVDQDRVRRVSGRGGFGVYAIRGAGAVVLRTFRRAGRISATGTIGLVPRPSVAQPISFRAVPTSATSYGATTVTLYGLAADGYDTVEAGGRRAGIAGNYFVLAGVRLLAPIPVTATGPAGAASTTLPSVTRQDRFPLGARPARPAG